MALPGPNLVQQALELKSGRAFSRCCTFCGMLVRTATLRLWHSPTLPAYHSMHSRPERPKRTLHLHYALHAILGGTRPMTPEEFRRLGHQIIDRIADYRATVAERPVMARTSPGEIKAALPADPPQIARIVRSHPGRSRPHRDARPLPLAASQFLRLLSFQRRTLQRPRRLPFHRPRRPRPLLAVQSGAHRDRRSGDRLDAPHDRPLRRNGAA